VSHASTLFVLDSISGGKRLSAETISIKEARRLALARAGLMKPEWTGFPSSAGKRPRAACYDVIRRFGYLQLDTVPIAGARSHGLVLLSRLPGLDPALPETLLRPRAPLFEYWGHEASWLPMELYPVFEFRRREMRKESLWWGPVLQENRRRANAIKKRIGDEGPLRSADFEDKSGRSEWGFSLTRRILRCLWWAGDIAVRERKNFQPLYDLTERVIPDSARQNKVAERDAFKTLVLKALDGHGWAGMATLADTWRLAKRRKLLEACLGELKEEGAVTMCSLGRHTGWIRPEDLELAARLAKARPRRDTGVLLSPFDPLLWDRKRVQMLFDFEQMLEIYKPVKERKYGYYCMPLLVGDELVGRCDLKADKAAGLLHVLSVHHEGDGRRDAAHKSLTRYADTLALKLDFGSASL